MNASQPTPNPQTLPAAGSSNSDRYAALADLDQEVRIQKTVERRSQFQKQISVGQQIFGATPSSVNPFLTKQPSNAQMHHQAVIGTNPFSSGQSNNPFM